MPKQPHPRTLKLLESAYRDFHSLSRRDQDPISLAHRYQRREDQEVVAFLTAILSYGNVKTILASVNCLLRPLGDRPKDAIVEGAFEKRLDDFKHRFTVGKDMEIVCFWLAESLKTHGTLEKFFCAHARPQALSMKELLASFTTRFTSLPLPERVREHGLRRHRSLKYLIASPDRGSACKRLNMFLRWMVRREDAVDLGLWNNLLPAQLMLPVDTHLLKTLRALRWTHSKQATWRVVEEATERLRLYAPEDPIRYDFALCHLSMTGGRLANYA